MNEPSREPGSYSPIDLDEVLKSRPICALSSTGRQDAVGRSGFFKADSNLLIRPSHIVDGQLVNPRTYICGTDGAVMCMQTLKSDTLEPGELYRYPIKRDLNSDKEDPNGFRIVFEKGHYYVEDLGGASMGTVLMKPQEVRQSTEKVDATTVKIQGKDISSYFSLSFGAESVVRFYMFEGIPGIIASDVSNLSHSMRQKLHKIQDGECLFLGSNPSANAPDEMCMKLEANDIKPAQLAVFYFEGNIYLINLAKESFGINIEPKVAESSVDPEQAEDVSEKISTPQRVDTGKLISDVNEDIGDLGSQGLQRKEIFRKLAQKYHPDLNLDDPENATRRMQMLNAWYYK